MIPHSPETEKALLGAIMVDDRQFDVILEYVNTPEAFKSEINSKIFAAMLDLKQKKQNIDLVTVVDRIPDATEYIATLTSSVVTSAHAEDYARQVADRHLRRQIFRACEESKKILLDEGRSASEAATEVDAIIGKAGRSYTLSGANLGELTTQRFNKYMEDAEMGIYWEGVKTGFKDLDELIDGLALGETVIIAARPSMGKTALALNVGLNAAKQGVSVHFFSMEMSKERITDRLLCMEAEVNAKRMRTRDLHEGEIARLEDAYNTLANLPVKIYDGSMNTAQIRSALARTEGKSMAIVDFLTLLTDHSNLSAHERYGAIIKSLQGMATEFNMPVVVLAQLNRKAEESSGARPSLSHLRESGNIEEAADKVLFIYREDYYNAATEKKGVAEIICSKNRDGEIGKAELSWRPEVLRFGNLSYAKEAR